MFERYYSKNGHVQEENINRQRPRNGQNPNSVSKAKKRIKHMSRRFTMANNISGVDSAKQFHALQSIFETTQIKIECIWKACRRSKWNPGFFHVEGLRLPAYTTASEWDDIHEATMSKEEINDIRYTIKYECVNRFSADIEEWLDDEMQLDKAEELTELLDELHPSLPPRSDEQETA